MPVIRKVNCSKCGEEYSAAGIRLHELTCKGSTLGKYPEGTPEVVYVKPESAGTQGVLEKTIAKPESASTVEVHTNPQPKPETVSATAVLKTVPKTIEEVPFHRHIENFEKRVCAEIIDSKCEHCLADVDKILFVPSPKVCWQCGSKLYPRGEKPEKCKLSYASTSRVEKGWLGLRCGRCKNDVEAKYAYCSGCGTILIHDPKKPEEKERSGFFEVMGGG